MQTRIYARPSVRLASRTATDHRAPGIVARPTPFRHQATVHMGRLSGWGDGRTQGEASRAAIIDALDTPGLEAPFRPGSAWLLGGMAGFAATVAALLLFAVNL